MKSTENTGEVETLLHYIIFIFVLKLFGNQVPTKMTVTFNLQYHTEVCNLLLRLNLYHQGRGPATLVGHGWNWPALSFADWPDHH